jgi:co-chaperonin GroES (HSP10)
MVERIPASYVLIELDALFYNKITLRSGDDLIIDPTYEPEKHHQTSGIVKAVPDSLYFQKFDMEFSMEYKVPVEIKEGDKVFFHYLQISSAISNNHLLKIDGKQHIFIRYDQCFCALRDDKFVMLNGWMLLEPINQKDKPKPKYIDPRLPKDRQEKNPLRGKILHLGESVTEYLWGGEETDIGIDVDAGDVVTFLPHSDIPLEYNLHRTLKNVYYRVQRKDLINKIIYE